MNDMDDIEVCGVCEEQRDCGDMVVCDGCGEWHCADKCFGGCRDDDENICQLCVDDDRELKAMKPGSWSNE